MPRIAIVTDSTASLSPDAVAGLDISVVPVQVIVDGHAYDEGAEISPLEVAQALRDSVSVTTSRPTPSAFIDLYRELAEQGVDAVVSIHLSTDLSSTYDSALLAAKSAPLPVVVVDSRSVSMGLGYAVIDAVAAAAEGSSPEDVAEVASQSAARNQVLFYVDSLEYLRRGGRIGSAQRIIGQALMVKPILHLVDGRVEPLEKVRTRGKALTRLLELAVEVAGDRPCRVSVQHLDAEQAAVQLADRLRERLGQSHVQIGEVGAVVGTHVGPGMISVIVSPIAQPA
jgi:DegV family protein with EDD domain